MADDPDIVVVGGRLIEKGTSLGLQGAEIERLEGHLALASQQTKEWVSELPLTGFSGISRPELTLPMLARDS